VNMTQLDVYISDNCWSCDETRQLVADIEPQFPGVTIELRDFDDDRRPSKVFATPTYVLNGRTIFLGNPTREQLQQKLIAALRLENKL